ncbi:SDR family oxidoreductase [Endozoicomonas sp. G2_2]|nr:SDR family oxidoreductase [Endozoicomonas sp. G2_2]
MDATVERFGQIDVLVNNAGVAVQKRIPDASDDDWSRVMRINVDGVFYCCRAALPHLRPYPGFSSVSIQSPRV